MMFPTGRGLVRFTRHAGSPAGAVTDRCRRLTWGIFANHVPTRKPAKISGLSCVSRVHRVTVTRSSAKNRPAPVPVWRISREFAERAIGCLTRLTAWMMTGFFRFKGQGDGGLRSTHENSRNILMFRRARTVTAPGDRAKSMPAGAHRPHSMGFHPAQPLLPPDRLQTPNA